ncbi:MAG: hypothetical protein MGG11_08495 [Trichodesmium sp. MAG_R03]|nr:hypothetical protein [Trichodesmium sp. MAG_R03]
MDTNKIGLLYERIIRIKSYEYTVKYQRFFTDYYSSSSLSNFHINSLKIYRYFLIRMDSESEKLEITKKIISLTINLEIDIILQRYKQQLN